MNNVKVHLLWKKEEIDAVQMNEDKIAVVFDILLATSTIATCLAYGAKHVVPVLDEAEALLVAKDYALEDVCLVGEYNGVTIDGFLDPMPLSLKEQVNGKAVVLSTTNGTVAIRKSAPAKEVYIASLLNGEAVVQDLMEIYDEETIIVVCSGSQNQFCVEDFYGAGYFIEQIVNAYRGKKLDLTDSALTAKLFYERLASEAVAVLSESRVGKMLATYGCQDDVTFVSQQGIYTVVPRLVDSKIEIVTQQQPIKRK